jgi:transcriptional regulator with PAS, ATPase and Fis domain
MESLIEEMLDGQIMLNEALCEFEKVYIQKALERYDEHLSNTASALGIHRNTLSKRVSTYQSPPKMPKRLLAKRAKSIT